MTSYGTKGGDGPTRGRKAQVLIDPVSGLRKRAFFGQRFLLVQQRDEQSTPMLRAYATRQEAMRQLDRDHRFGFTVEYVTEAQAA